MIPATIDVGTRSPGERQVFKRLQDDPDTNNWVVLHSFNLPEHPTRIQGEVDFVVFVPEEGILCLEIKAHLSARRNEDGYWLLGADSATSRSPFKQAEDAMHGLKSQLNRLVPVASEQSLIWSAVLFTHTSFDVPATEWREWEALDTHDFHRRPISALIRGVLRNAHRLDGMGRKLGPSAAQCEEMARALRPSFEVARPPGYVRAERDAELLTFTAEQYFALDAMSQNPRVVFEGPAGTGKTFIGLEAARRHAEEGARVGLLCYNRLLGEWLGEAAASLQLPRRAGTFHRLLLDIAGVSAPAGAGEQFFLRELPELAMEKLLMLDEPPFEVMIVDEFQDLLRESYLDCLDLMLVGGLAAGQWRLFGDFERQALYGSDGDVRSMISNRCPTAPTFSLRVNCRNTPRLAKWVSMLSAMDPPYADVRRPDAGPPPRARFYNSQDDQVALLLETLQSVFAEGYSGQDVVVLSPLQNGAAANVRSRPWSNRIAKLIQQSDRTSGHVRYTTVQAFKGLEASVIIVTDIEAVADARSRAVFYTAATRATERLFVLAHKSVASEMLDVVDQFTGG